MKQVIIDIIAFPVDDFHCFMSVYCECPGISSDLLFERFPSKDYVVRALYDNLETEELYRFNPEIVDEGSAIAFQYYTAYN